MTDVCLTVFNQSGVMGLFMDAFFPPAYLTHDGRFNSFLLGYLVYVGISLG